MGGCGKSYGEEIEGSGLFGFDIPSCQSLCSTNACSILHHERHALLNSNLSL